MPSRSRPDGTRVLEKPGFLLGFRQGCEMVLLGMCPADEALLAVEHRRVVAASVVPMMGAQAAKVGDEGFAQFGMGVVFERRVAQVRHLWLVASQLDDRCTG